MIELIYNFVGFCLVIILPMFITIGFTIMKNYYDEKKYKAGYDDGKRCEMTNREQYERMIYLENNEIMLLLEALEEAWCSWGEPYDDDAMKLHDKIKQHYKLK